MKLDYVADRLLLEADPRWTDVVKQIPLARFDGVLWELPPTLQSFFALSILMQGATTPGPEARQLYQDLFIAATGRASGILPDASSHWKIAKQAMDHQLYAMNFMDGEPGILLADDMGLGKTFMSLATINPQDGPVVIVCPKSVAYKWEAEIKRWHPEADVRVAVGAAGQRRKAIEKWQEAGWGYLVMNYEALVSHIHLVSLPGVEASGKDKERKELSDLRIGTVIVDEAHKIKSRKAKRTRACWALGDQAVRRFALTGTPLADSPVDLYSILRFVRPDIANDWSRWRDLWIDYSPSYVHPGFDYHGFRQDRWRLFSIMLDDIMLRRTKDEVLDDRLGKLPPDVRLLDMGTKQSQLYRKLSAEDILCIEGRVLAATNPLEKRLRHRQLAFGVPILEEVELDGKVYDNIVGFETSGSCKIDAVLDIIEEGGDDKLVVFTESKLACKAIHQAVNEAGYATEAIHEEVSPEMRQLHVTAFQEGQLQVLCLTTGTGAEGIDLFASARVVFAQRSDSNIANRQAEDRVDRIGQTRAVQPIYLISRHTVDEDVEVNVASKEELLQEVLRD